MKLGTRLTAALVCALTIVGLGTVSALGADAASGGPRLPSHDPFYSYHHPLSHVAPGTVLKTRTIALANTPAGDPTQATQVLYRTTGELGQPTVTVATIIRPLSHGSTKILSYQTAYDALGHQSISASRASWVPIPGSPTRRCSSPRIATSSRSPRS
jgi:hypothetical protein